MTKVLTAIAIITLVAAASFGTYALSVAYTTPTTTDCDEGRCLNAYSGDPCYHHPDGCTWIF